MTVVDESTVTVQTLEGPKQLRGFVLGEASSHRPVHSHGGNFVQHGQGRCSACRWMEVVIFWDSENECYAVVTRGMTRVPKELERGRIERTPSALWVIECLIQPSNTAPGGQKLSATARKALAHAAKVDADIADAYRDRADLIP